MTRVSRFENCQPSPGWSLSSSLVWRSPFPVTLQRIFNTCLKKISLVFCCYFWTLQQKPHDFCCSGCKNMVSQKCAVFIGPPCSINTIINKEEIKVTLWVTTVIGALYTTHKLHRSVIDHWKTTPLEQGDTWYNYNHYDYKITTHRVQ